MLTLETFIELKDWLRIDEDDKALAMDLNAAKSYLEDSGVPESSITEARLDKYKQTILYYIEMDYETDTRKIASIEKKLNRNISQLSAGIPYEG